MSIAASHHEDTAPRFESLDHDDGRPDLLVRHRPAYERIVGGGRYVRAAILLSQLEYLVDRGRHRVGLRFLARGLGWHRSTVASARDHLLELGLILCDAGDSGRTGWYLRDKAIDQKLAGLDGELADRRVLYRPCLDAVVESRTPRPALLLHYLLYRTRAQGCARAPISFSELEQTFGWTRSSLTHAREVLVDQGLVTVTDTDGPSAAALWSVDLDLLTELLTQKGYDPCLEAITGRSGEPATPRSGEPDDPRSGERATPRSGEPATEDIRENDKRRSHAKEPAEPEQQVDIRKEELATHIVGTLEPWGVSRKRATLTVIGLRSLGMCDDHIAAWVTQRAVDWQERLAKDQLSTSAPVLRWLMSVKELREHGWRVDTSLRPAEPPSDVASDDAPDDASTPAPESRPTPEDDAKARYNARLAELQDDGLSFEEAVDTVDQEWLEQGLELPY
jgi:hypothetical protein